MVWIAQKGAIQNRNSDLKHGLNDVIACALFDLLPRDKLRRMRCAMAQYERARNTLGRILL